MATPLERLQGKYEILEKLREGGMGAIYKVRHRLLDEIRVIKIIRPQLEGQEELQERFSREARLMVRFRHVNIAQVFDFSIDDDGIAFIVQEFIDGITVEELLRNTGAPSVGFALEIARQTLLALAYLHRKEVIHRDVAPDNIMLCRDEDGGALVKLIDLGIAKALAAHSSMTMAGEFIGKIRYASPEQFRVNEGIKLDNRSDIYSFGVVLYELLTGKHPIIGTSVPTLIAGHVMNPPLPFDQSDPDGRIPLDLRSVVIRCLAKKAEDRYANAEAMLAELTPLQTRFRIGDNELDHVLSSPEDATKSIRRPKVGSTQGRLDQQFIAQPTPPPIVPVSAAHKASNLDLVDQAVASITQGVASTPPPLANIAPSLSEKEIDKLVANASSLCESLAFEQAVATIERGIGLAPESDKLRAAFAWVKEQRNLHQQDQLRRRKLSVATAEIEGFVSAGRLLEAEEVLRKIQSEAGDDKQLDGPRKKLAEAQGRARQSRVSDLLKMARQAVEKKRFAEGVEYLEQALVINPDDEMVSRILAKTKDDWQKVEQEEHLSQVLAQLAPAVEKHLSHEQFDAALDKIAKASMEFTDMGAFAVLSKRVEDAAAEQSRRNTVTEILQWVDTLMAREEYVNAVTALKEAQILDKGNPEIRRRLKEADAAIANLTIERRQQQEVAAAAASIEEAVEKGDLAGAGRALAVAGKMFPNEPTFVGLRRQVEQLQELEKEDKIDNCLSQAITLADGGEVERAVNLLRETMSGEGANPRLANMLENLQRRQAEKSIEAALARGDLRETERALALAEKLYGQHRSLRALRHKLEELRATKK